MKTSAIDVFCGIGGLSYGLKKAGISVVAGIDVDESCTYPYEHNVGARFILRDVYRLRGEEINKEYWRDDVVRILVGCAPCQPFSTHSNKLKDKTRSDKWQLLREFGRLVGETRPHVVTMENVPNLANQQVFKDFVAFLERSGYHVWRSNVYCPDYGIPQRRRRLVLLASVYRAISLVPATPPQPECVSLKRAIGHLPPVEAGEVCASDPLHRAPELTPINLQRIKASRPGGTWLDWGEDLRLQCHKRKAGTTYKAVYGRMAWDEPSSTITTQFYNYGTGRFGHPEQNRALTIREAAILQTFPEDYAFYEDESDILPKRLSAHIGNAVPVELGVVIGESILAHLEVDNGTR